MELMDVLRNRRAVRDYSGDRLTRQVIERLIEAAILAPSAMNLQPWAFAALLDPDVSTPMGSARGNGWWRIRPQSDWAMQRWRSSKGRVTTCSITPPLS